MKFFIIIPIIGATVFAILNRQKAPKTSAFIFLGMGLISLIIYLMFEGLVMKYYVDQWELDNAPYDHVIRVLKDRKDMISFGKPLMLLLTLLLLLFGGYFLYKSNTKKLATIKK